MAEINDIRKLDERPLTNGWHSSREALGEYENIFGQLSRHYSMFEIALNVNFGTQEGLGRFFKAFCECNRERPDCFLSFFVARDFKRSFVVFVFRCFFERGKGSDLYRQAAEVLGVKPALVTVPLRMVWQSLFSDDDLKHQERGIPEEIFKSRCWLIKNFQNKQGNSNLCHAVKRFQDFGGCELRFCPDAYRDCPNHLRRLLTDRSCALEREFFVDFADNGATDNIRFAWFEMLDDENKRCYSPLLRIIMRDNDDELCFQVNENYVFDVDESVDRINIKFILRMEGAQSSTCSFERGKGFRWKCINNITVPLWNVKSIVRSEVCTGERKIVKIEDCLGSFLRSGMTEPSGSYGAFIVNSTGNGPLYFPSSPRILPRGDYKLYVFEIERGGDFKIRAYLRDNVEYSVDDQIYDQVGKDRRLNLSENDVGNLSVRVLGIVFKFGIRPRSAIESMRVSNIRALDSRYDTRHVFLNVGDFKYSSLEGWEYESGEGRFNNADELPLYGDGGILRIWRAGHCQEEHNVVFIDFSPEAILDKMPSLCVGQSNLLRLSGINTRVDGDYEISEKANVLSIPIRGTCWKVMAPVDREGISFQTDEGEVALSVPFRDETDISQSHFDLATEDFRHLVCHVSLTSGYDSVEIFKVTTNDNTELSTRIVLFRRKDGFRFLRDRSILAKRSGGNASVILQELLDGRGRISRIFISANPAANRPDLAKKYCIVNLYDPKSVYTDREIANGQIRIDFPSSFYSIRKPIEMRWLPSDQMDCTMPQPIDWVNKGDSFSQNDDNGRWTRNLTATTLHNDFRRVLDRGAAMLAFIVEKDSGRLASGGFCLFDGGNAGLTVRMNNDLEWGYRLRRAMHYRYGHETRDLDTLCSILTLRCCSQVYNDLDRLKRYLREHLGQLLANIRGLGRGADLFMNAIYNVMGTQWSGYAYLAGWYFAEQVAKEMFISEGVEIESCRCFLSSTGVRVWSPLMLSRYSIQMATATVGNYDGINVPASQWWNEYYRRLGNEKVCINEVAELVIDFAETAQWYMSGLRHALSRVEIVLPEQPQPNEIVDAAKTIVNKVFEWRDAAKCEDLSPEAAGELMTLTQNLRSCLLELDNLDVKALDICYCKMLFYGLIKRIDAQRMVKSLC